MSNFRNILRYGPGWLIITAGVLLSLQAVLVSKYYSDMFPPDVWNVEWRTWLAAISSAALKMLAFFLLFLTVKNFADGRKRIGRWGLAATVVLNLYFLLECHFMAALWSHDADTYRHLFPFLTTITVMVLFVEWRLAATTSADATEENALEHAETLIADYRKQLDAMTGKVTRYEAEKASAQAAIESEAIRRAEEEAAAEERRRQEEYDNLRKQLAAANRQLASAEKTTGGKTPVNPDAVRRAAGDFMRKNRGFRPTQSQIATALNVTERTLRNALPNGSWDAQIEELFHEINHEQPEISTAN